MMNEEYKEWIEEVYKRMRKYMDDNHPEVWEPGGALTEETILDILLTDLEY